MLLIGSSGHWKGKGTPRLRAIFRSDKQRCKREKKPRRTYTPGPRSPRGCRRHPGGDDRCRRRRLPQFPPRQTMLSGTRPTSSLPCARLGPSCARTAADNRPYSARSHAAREGQHCGECSRLTAAMTTPGRPGVSGWRIVDDHLLYEQRSLHC
jgi:hypothetical protein